MLPLDAALSMDMLEVAGLLCPAPKLTDRLLSLLTSGDMPPRKPSSSFWLCWFFCENIVGRRG